MDVADGCGRDGVRRRRGGVMGVMEYYMTKRLDTNRSKRSSEMPF